MMMEEDKQIQELREGYDYLCALLSRSVHDAAESVIDELKRHEDAGGRRVLPRFDPIPEALGRHVHSEKHRGAGERPGRELIWLGAMGQHARLVQDARVANAAERIERLAGGDVDAAFEIEVAALHLACGRATSFVAEGDTRSPDLLVVPDVEVECKCLRALTKRDHANREMWRQTQRRVYEVVSRGGWYVECETEEQMTADDVEWLLSQLEVAKSETREVEVTEASRRCRLAPMAMSTDVAGFAAGAPAGAPALETFDVGKVELTGLTDGRGIEPVSAFVFAFRTREESDWMKRVRGALGGARRQLSGDRPGVVFVDVPPRPGPELGGVRARVASAFEAGFRSSARLSAAVGCFTELGHAQNGPSLLRSYEFERNDRARHPVPEAAAYFGR